MDSTGDDVNQLKNNYKKYAEAVVDAVLEYKNLSPSTSSDYYIVKSGDKIFMGNINFGNFDVSFFIICNSVNI